MKENRLIEMERKVAILGDAVNRMINDIEFIKTVAMGDHSVIKKLKEFPAIIEELKEEHGKEEDTTGTPSGDSGSTDSGLELE